MLIKFRFFFLILTILLVFFILISDFLEIEEFWSLIKIKHMTPLFADLRTIPDYTSYYQENFHNNDPWGRPFNYPSIWVFIISAIALVTNPYYLIGIIQLVAYPTLFFKISKSFTYLNDLILFFICYFSPPVFLLLERGNNDGIVVLLLLLIMVVRNSFAKGIIYSISISLKVFPVFALLGSDILISRQFKIGCIIASPLILLTLIDLPRIFSGTPIGWSSSYGIMSSAQLACKLWLAQLESSSCHTLYFQSVLLTVFIMFVALILYVFKKNINSLVMKIEAEEHSSYLFFVFSSIYLGTLLLFGNWAYRLIVLLPVLYILLIAFPGKIRNKNFIVHVIILLTLISFIAPYIPTYGWIIPQASTLVLGVFLAAIHLARLRLKWGKS